MGQIDHCGRQCIHPKRINLTQWQFEARENCHFSATAP
jgi:hypothetical protein